MADRSVRVRMSVDAETSGVDQYNRKMREAENTTKDVGKASQSFGSQIENLNQKFSMFMGAGILGFGLGTLKGFAEEMYNAGAVSNQTAAIFEQMITPMTSVEDMMQRLRDATLGIASDTDIQTGANMLLRMGIAGSPEELEQIISLVTRLKSPTEDLGTAINNFSLMMANQSVLRLDSFGLSSGKVRERIDELLASGQALDREQAFKMATLEEGARAVERLGDAATVAATPVAILQTKIENLGSELSGRFAQGVEGLAGIALVALELTPQQEAIHQRNLDRMKSLSERAFIELAQMTRDVLNPRDEVMLGDNFITTYLMEAIRAVSDDPDLLGDLEDLRKKVIEALPMEMGAMARTGWYEGQLSELDLLVLRSSNLLEIEAKQEEVQARIYDVMQRIGDLRDEGLRVGEQMLSNVREQAAAHEMTGLAERLDTMREVADLMGAAEMPKFMDADSAQGFRVMADTAQAMVDEMMRLDEMDGDLFSADEVKRAQDTAKELEQIAKDAEKAADAFEKISLSDIFGTGGRALEMDINRIIMAALPEGTTDEQRAAIERQLKLQSGEETESSLFFQEQLIPGILAQSQDPEVIAAASQALADVFRAATLEGIDTGDMGFMTAIQNALSPENLEAFDAESFVQAFQDAASGAGEIDTGLSGAANSLEISARASADMRDNLELGSKNADRIASSLKTAFDRPYNLTVNIDAIAPPWLRTILNDPSGASFGAMMEKNTRDNGGVPPGSTRGRDR